MFEDEFRLEFYVIFHKGDFGKEPMAIIFGETPNNTIKKLLKITG